MLSNLEDAATAVVLDDKTGAYNEESPIYKMRKFGFRALLGWHYLVLFSPLFVMGNLDAGMAPLAQRQFVLYVTLAVVFLVLMIVTRVSPQAKDKVIATPCIGVTCIIGFAVTLVTGLALDVPYPAKIALTVLLGIAESILMLAWLTIFIGLNKKQTYRTLGMDVITGSIVALLVESLSGPANIVVAACLPLLSMFSFVILKRKYDMQETADADASAVEAEAEAAEEAGEAADNGSAPESTSESGAADLKHSILAKRQSPGRYLMKRILPAALFALAFGIVQGGFLADGEEVLLAFNPLVYLGVTLAGVITFFTMERFCTHTDVDFTYRLSLGFFMLGIVLLAAMLALGAADTQGLSGIVLVLAGIAVFAGFNLFDFGNMMLCLGIVRLYGHKNDYFVSMGRFAVYLCMSIGFLASYLVVAYGLPLVGAGILTIVCCVALLILVVTVALSGVTSQDDMEFLMANGIGVVGTGDSSGSRPCDFCDSDGNCAVQTRAAELSEEVKAELAATEADEAAAGDAGRGTGTAAAEEAEPQDEDAGQQEAPTTEPRQRRRAPWREACEEICKRYQLSKRETQIFMMIAKGRNAEYVSEKLVISIHTAKTHIANIYQKLDVHSNQEVLDLVDAFREDADRQ